MQRAGALFAAGQFAQALQQARAALDIDSGNADLHNLMGACAMRLGDRVLAERAWLQASTLQPQRAQFHLNLGLLLAQSGRAAEAERRFRQVLLLDPASVQASFNLAYLLSTQGRAAEAEQLYRRSVLLAPNHAEAHYNLGVLLSERGLPEAEPCYRRVLALDPRHADAAFNLGSLLAGQRRVLEAEQCFRLALELEPGNANTLFNLGRLLAEGGREEEAERHFRRAIELQPGLSSALIHLGVLLEARNRPDAAEQCYRQALRNDPTLVDAHYNLGVVLVLSGQERQAEQCYRRVLQLDASHAKAYFNLAILLSRREQYDEAERCYRQALTHRPELVQASRNLATLLLQQGRFEEGWLHYESRHDPRYAERTVVPPQLPFPQWRGQDLRGKSLLIWPEQGYGDQIQMCRYLPLLKQLGAVRLAVVCDSVLRPVLQTLDGIDVLLDEDQPLDGAHYDYWCLLLSVPRWCSVAGGIPALLPYLRSDPARVAKWSARMPRDGLRIGLVWKGSSAHPDDSLRSLPGLECLAPLWSVPGVHFISLQKGQGEDQARRPPTAQPLIHLGSDIGDFADTAAVIELLDLLICVDTAVAHLAGALGKPCWVLRPPTDEWRWPPPGCRDSLWYPGILRLFGIRPGESWDAAIAAVRESLHEQVARGRD